MVQSHRAGMGGCRARCPSVRGSLRSCPTVAADSIPPSFLRSVNERYQDRPSERVPMPQEGTEADHRIVWHPLAVDL